MKLCMVNGYFHPFIGGSEKNMYEIGKRLARVDDVSVVTSQMEGTSEFEVIEGINVHRLPTKHYKMPVIYPPPLPVTKGVISRIAKLDDENQYDVFNLHGRWFGSYNSVVDYAKKKKKLMVFTLHNARPVGISKTIDLFGTTYDGLRGKDVLRSVDRIISVSHALKKDIMEYGLDGDKIDVIYNGVDTEFYKPSEKTFREEHAEGFDNLLVFVGRIIQQKGLDHLIDAMPAILKEHKSTRLLIVGKGKLVPRLQEKISKMGLDNNIIFPGFIDDARMPELYSSADLFVLPSLWETFGFVLVEAGACGTPLCGSNAGGIPEVIQDGKNGLVFEKADPKALANKVNIMLSDNNLRRDMGRKSREIAVEKFDWEIISDQTKAFYSRAMEEFY